MERNTKSLWMLVGAIAVIVSVGCGPSGSGTASLSGTVTFDGEPLADGTIQLRPTGDTPGVGGTSKITNGSYSIPLGGGMDPGAHSVVIMATRPATPQEIAQTEKDSTAGETAMGEEDEGDAAPAAEPATPMTQYLPAKYNSQTTLTADIVAGENTKDFALEK